MKKVMFLMFILASFTNSSCSGLPTSSASNCQTLLDYKMENIEEFQIKHHTPEHIQMIEEALQKNDSSECDRVFNIIK